MKKFNIFIHVDLPDTSYLELTCYYTWLGADGIIRTKVKNGAQIELEQALENSKAVNSFGVGPFPLIVDTAEIRSISKEARDYLSIRGRSSNINCIAIIRGSHVGNMVANFFIGLNKPAVPTRLFTTEYDAIEWCLKQKNETNAVQ